MENGTALPVTSTGYEMTIKDWLTHYVIVAVYLPDRWIFYERATDNEVGYARGKVWSYPHRAPSFSDATSGQFRYEFDRVNHQEENDRYVAMAILSLLHDTVPGSVPAQLTITMRREAIVNRFYAPVRR